MKKEVLLFYFLISVILGKEYSLERIPDNYNFGVQKIQGNSFSFTGEAQGLGDFSDDIFICYDVFSGNTTTTLTNVSSNKTGSVGLIMRESVSQGAKYISLIKVADSLCLSYRVRDGAKSKVAYYNVGETKTLRLVRNGDTYLFQYKKLSDSTYSQLQTSLSIDMSYSLCAGFYLFGDETNQFDVEFTGYVDGVVSDSSEDGICFGFDEDFNSSVTIEGLGFKNVSNWFVDTGVAKTNTIGGMLNPATMLKDSLMLVRDTSAVTVAFDFFFDGINSGKSHGNVFNSVIFAKDTISLGSGSYVTGSKIRSNSIVVLKDNVQARTDIDARNKVHIGSNSVITGNIHTSALSNSGSYTLSGTVHLDTILPQLSIPSEVFTSGTQDVIINSNQAIQVLPVGSYKDVVIHDNCQVHLQSGDYYLNTLSIGKNAGLVLPLNSDANARVFITSNFSIDNNSHVTITYGQDFDRLQIYTNQQTPVEVGESVLFSGNLIAPYSTVNMDLNAQLHGGGIYANKVFVGKWGHVYHYGDSTTTEISGERPDIFSVMVGDSLNEYQVSIQPALDTLPGKSLISLAYNNIELTSSVVDSLPIKQWLKGRLELFPGSPLGPAGVHFFVDDGSGYKMVLYAQEWYLSQFTQLGFDYYTSVEPFNNRLFLDNVSTSCDDNSCDYITIMEQPSDTVVFEDSLAFFKVIVKEGDGVSYQWYMNDSLLEGKITNVLVVDTSKIEYDESLFKCKIMNICDTLFSREASLIVLPCENPVIVSQPQNTTLAINQSASFFVSATGHQLAYQWKKNGITLAGQNQPLLIIDSVSIDNNYESYSVVVTNGCGKAVVSQSAILTIADEHECQIVKEPEGDTLVEGDMFTTFVETSCDNADITWYKNGTKINGATSLFINSEPLLLENSGDRYHCVVSSGSYEDTSIVAEVIVLPMPAGHRRISVKGRISYKNDSLVADSSSKLMDFKVRLFNKRVKGKLLYSELFTGNRSVFVQNGDFTITLGTGKTKSDLQTVVAQNDALYAEISAKLNNGKFEQISDRLPFSGSPFSLQAEVHTITGVKSPIDENIIATLGTLFVGEQDSSLWVNTASGWKRIN